MQGAIGLLLYVAVMILGGILKKTAEDKARRAQTPIFAEDEVYTVTLDDILGEESPVEGIAAEESLEPPGFRLTIADRLEDFHSQGSEEFEDWDDEDSESHDDSELRLDSVMVPRESHWAQAIVLSEIIREPRAKRPWPSR